MEVSPVEFLWVERLLIMFPNKKIMQLGFQIGLVAVDNMMHEAITVGYFRFECGDICVYTFNCTRLRSLERAYLI